MRRPSQKFIVCTESASSVARGPPLGRPATETRLRRATAENAQMGGPEARQRVRRVAPNYRRPPWLSVLFPRITGTTDSLHYRSLKHANIYQMPQY